MAKDRENVVTGKGTRGKGGKRTQHTKRTRGGIQKEHGAGYKKNTGQDTKRTRGGIQKDLGVLT